MSTTSCNRDCEDECNRNTKEEVETHISFSTEYVWRNVFISVILHAIALYELVKILLGMTPFSEFLFAYGIAMFNHMSVNVGAHRLWSHRSFKARLPLKLWLLFTFTMAGQNSVYEWVRDHRVHHKYAETDADPHNIKRGFFFAHMGWLLCKKHPAVREKGKSIDLSDLESDPLIMLHHRWYPCIAPIFIFLIPSLFFSCLFPSSSSWTIFAKFGVLRYVLSLHVTWLINSYSHMFGNRPYDKTIRSTDSLWYGGVSMGEGWHNYHHVFPWDYRSSEWYSYFGNLSTLFIDVMAWLGQAYDLKTVDYDVIKKRVIRTGDGTHPLWGWGDEDTSDGHVNATITLYKQD